MPERPLERVSKYLLSGATEDTYSSQVAQNPTTARRVQSLFPSPAGYLERENPNVQYGLTTLPSGVFWLFEYAQNNSGTVLRFWFCATSTTLYQLVGTPETGVWTAVTQVGTLAHQPVARVINNLMHFSDGVSSFIFDGTNWVTDGLPIPQHAPTFAPFSPAAPTAITAITRINGTVHVTCAITGVIVGSHVTLAGVSDTTFNGEQTVTSAGTGFFEFMQIGFPDASLGATGTAQLSNFSILNNRYYWTTFVDDSGTHPHESSSSPRSLGTGPITNQIEKVFQRKGTISTVGISTSIVGVGTDFDQNDVGMDLCSTGGFRIRIVAVADPQHLTLDTITSGLAGNNYVIVPPRATRWNIYCSETENSAVGFFLASVLINATPAGLSYNDQSPFSNDPNSYINLALQRPIRNDPTKGTRVMSVHKRRIFRRDEALPSYFYFTAFEEVKSTGVGTAEECVPGLDPNTLSDLVNEDPYSDQSHTITGMVSHADALFIGTERSVTPLFGETLDDFTLSQINAFSVGFASVYALTSMPHGLGFLSYDRKVYLWPQQWVPFYAPEETTSLIELSRPLRLRFQSIDPAFLGQTWFEFFNYGQRNWLVTAWKSADDGWHTYVFDFETKGWFELQRGVQSLAVFEPVAGIKVLVGGGTDGKVYVLDDPSGHFSTTGLNFPIGTFRPALIDFGQPDTKHMPIYVEVEVDNNALINDLSVNYYLDPVDVDNPGTPLNVIMTQVRGANRWRGFLTNNGGTVCERILMEFILASSINDGVIRSITLAAKPVSKLIL